MYNFVIKKFIFRTMFHYSVSIGTGVSVLSLAFSGSLAVVTGVCVLLSDTAVPALGTALERSPDYFSYFSTKTYVVGTQKNRLNETVIMSTQNTCLN